MKASLSYSPYDVYKVDKTLELKLPNIDINFQKEAPNIFSYFRKSKNDFTKKTVQSSGSLEVILCPVLPLNLPVKKTNDLMFLRLDNQIVVNANSRMEILVQFPIEIGIFVKNEKSSDMIDVVTCEPMHSRFALYGTPEKGFLCKYSRVSQINDESEMPYVWAKMKILIENELDHAVTIGRFVFRLTGHQVYYKQEATEVHVDDLHATVFSDISGEKIELTQIDFARKKESWNLSPPIARTVSTFLMEKGFD